MEQEHFHQAASLHESVLQRAGEPELRYTIAIPEQRTADDRLPLVIALHYGWPGSGLPAPFYGKGVLLGLARPALAELGAIIVAPDCPDRVWTSQKSADAVIALLEDLQQEYPVDRNKVLLTGFSLGGLGTWYLASQRTEHFSAAIPISAVPYEEGLDRIEGIPLYVIHSRQDELMPIEKTESAVHRLRARGVSVEFAAVEGITHYETYRFVGPLKKSIPWIRAVWARG